MKDLVFPMSTDAAFNNALIQLPTEAVNAFLGRLLENRKDFLTPAFRLSIKGASLGQPIYLLPFLKEGKTPLQIGNSHHIVMIFRNSSLINK